MKTLAVVWLAALAAALSSHQACAQYSDTLAKKVIAAIVDEPKQWTAFNYPTDNFGVGTMYDGRRAEDFLCATVTCLGLDSLEDVGRPVVEMGEGGGIQLTAVEKKQALIGGFIPQLLKTLGLKASVSSDSVTLTTFEIGEARKRYLVRSEAMKAITAFPSNHPVKKAFNAGQLRVAVADIVVESFAADVKIASAGNAEVIAKLDAAAVHGGSTASDANIASLKLSLQKTGEGEYRLVSKHPVVVGVLVRRQPESGQLASPTGWDDWPQVEAADVEHRLAVD